MDQLNQIEELYNKIPKQVIAKFYTKLTQYQIDETQIDLPTEMDEIQCNKLLKQFLQSNFDSQLIKSLQFQFLVGGKLLRGQLKSHILRYEISCQQTLSIQYFLAFQPLETQNTIPQEDWVSVLELVSHPQGNLFISGLFSGQATLHSRQNKQILKLEIDQDCLKAIKIVATQQENSYYLISGGVNQQIRIGNLILSNGKGSFQPLSVTQQEGSILGIDANPIDDGHFCTVNDSGRLSIYKIPQNFLNSDEPFNQLKKKKKKRHLNQKSITTVISQQIHDDSINCVKWINQDRIVTGSADHSMKLIDVQTMKRIGSVLTKDSITTSIDYANDRLLTSHQDGYIRLWDIRAPQTPTNSYKAHSKLVSSVKYNPRSYIFSSGSYDTTIKIWDYRSAFPIQNIGTHHDKVFNVLWKNQKQLIGGGADSKISTHQV